MITAIRTNHYPKTTTPKPLLQNHYSKTTTPKPLLEHYSKTTTPKPLLQNHYSKTTTPKPLLQNHYSKTTTPKPLLQNHYSKTLPQPPPLNTRYRIVPCSSRGGCIPRSPPPLHLSGGDGCRTWRPSKQGGAGMIGVHLMHCLETAKIHGTCFRPFSGLSPFWKSLIVRPCGVNTQTNSGPLLSRLGLIHSEPLQWIFGSTSVTAGCLCFHRATHFGVTPLFFDATARPFSEPTTSALPPFRPSALGAAPRAARRATSGLTRPKDCEALSSEDMKLLFQLQAFGGIWGSPDFWVSFEVNGLSSFVFWSERVGLVNLQDLGVHVFAVSGCP